MPRRGPSGCQLAAHRRVVSVTAVASDSYDLVVCGLGSAGMVAAQLAHRLGLRVAGVEAGRIGGDCLWSGCVPSKALVASARVAHVMREAGRWGIEPAPPRVDLARVWRRIHEVQEELAAGDDSPQRLRSLGIEVVEGRASLGAVGEVRAGDRVLRTRFVLVCTGSSPSTPDLPGIEDVDFLTTQSLWAREAPPASLTILGGGPASVELAQSLRRLGVETTLLVEEGRLLMDEEPVHADELAGILRAEGVRLACEVHPLAARREGSATVLETAAADGTEASWRADALLAASGRTPNVTGLGLEAHGIRWGPNGIVADGSGRTAAPWVYAVGDVTGRHLSAHAAAAEAARAVRTMLFPGVARGPAVVPRCTFTDPELAAVGLSEDEAREAHGSGVVRVWERSLEKVDRARIDGRTAGSVRIVTARGRVAGASVLAPCAGELIGELTHAVEQRWKLMRLAAAVHVYPSLATTIQELAADAAIAASRPVAGVARFTRKKS